MKLFIVNLSLNEFQLKCLL